MFGIAPGSIGPIGVDLAESGVKVLQLRTVPGTGAVVVAIARLEAGPNDAGLAEELRRAVSGADFRGNECVVGLPRHDVFTGTIRVPSGPRAELEASVRAHASRRLGVVPAAIDAHAAPTGAVVQGTDGAVEVLATAVSQTTLRRRLAVIAAAGLRPVAVESAASALVRAFAAGRSPCVILDGGASGASLVIARDTDVVRVRPIPVGGVDIDRALRRRLACDLVEAYRAGVDGHAAVRDAVRPLVRQIAREVRLALRAYGASFRGPGPERVVITGGAARLSELAVLIRETCGIPAVDGGAAASPVLDSWRAVPVRSGALPAWTTALGLACRRGAAERDLSMRAAA